MQKIYEVLISDEVKDQTINKIWSKNVLEHTNRIFQSLEYFPTLGHKYIFKDLGECYGIYIHPFVYFYIINEDKKIVKIFDSYYGSQNYWSMFTPL
ncbi:MAG: hypothetical protein LBS76_03560 [Mycoplasmataceae bacterium]|jgi:hypothetical protein|nr:hypothetical protein [Mycoplasmataceae bacterium]